MHVHEYRMHPDWIARLQMFRQYSAQSSAVPTPDLDSEPEAPTNICQRWPLPKISYRHRKSAAPRPR